MGWRPRGGGRLSEGAEHHVGEQVSIAPPRGHVLEIEQGSGFGAEDHDEGDPNDDQAAAGGLKRAE